MPSPEQSLIVSLPRSAVDRDYPIHIGRGLIADADYWARLLSDRDVVLVTNETIAPLYQDKLLSALGPRRVSCVVLPDGERHKHYGSIEAILDQALAERHERRSIFIALGGGVIGDMTGFAASIFLRGADFIQVPTTLLAQVDSSVGGKTGINHVSGKNLIGAFHQPIAVVIDLNTIVTLPAREYAAGMAEVVKYGLIRDKAFLSWLYAHQANLLARDPETISEAIYRSCGNKVEVVAADERESGVRATLNLGHTFGHAIELTQGYGAWLHGEAVACGMVLATKISAARGWLEAAEVSDLIGFLEALSLPVIAPSEMTAESFLQAMAGDKKVSKGTIRYILLRELGQAVIVDDITPQEIEQALAR
jgi:3-dehydroquinate synthase